MKTAIVIPDTHVPLHDKKQWCAIKKLIKHNKPDMLIHLGDLGEWDSVSHWKYKRRKKPPVDYIIPDVEKDLVAVSMFMDEINELGINKKYLTMGNHDMWMEHFKEEYPHIDPRYTLSYLPWKGWEIIPEYEHLIIGNMHFYHGHAYGGIHHARKHQQSYNVDIMYGHYHSLQVYRGSDYFGGHTSYCLGALKQSTNNANQWVKARAINWNTTIAWITFIGGTAHVQLIPVDNGTIVFNKKVFKCTSK